MQSSALDDRMLDWWLNASKRVTKARRKDFDSIFALTWTMCLAGPSIEAAYRLLVLLSSSRARGALVSG
jgi:hypothetical protein